MLGILYLDENPEANIRSYVDEDVVEKIFQYTRLLSSVYHNIGSSTKDIYKPEPALYSTRAFEWLFSHQEHYTLVSTYTRLLLEEFTHRFNGEVHPSSETFLSVEKPPAGLDRYTRIRNPMPPHLTLLNEANRVTNPETGDTDFILSNRKEYFENIFQKEMTWRNRSTPYWIIQFRSEREAAMRQRIYGGIPLMTTPTIRR